MQIRSRLSISADGFITTPGGWPAGTPDVVVTDSDPSRLLETIRASNRGRDAASVPGRDAAWVPDSQRRS